MTIGEPRPRTSSLCDLWISELKAVAGERSVRPLTPKERGQLKNIANGIGANTKQVIVFAIRNWPRFAPKAADCAGLSAWPDSPHVGFLLAHFDVAINMLQPIAATAAIDKHEPTVKPSAPIPRTAKEAPYRPTQDEIDELLRSLTEGANS